MTHAAADGALTLEVLVTFRDRNHNRFNPVRLQVLTEMSSEGAVELLTKLEELFKPYDTRPKILPASPE